MHIFAVEAVGEFIRMSLADHPGARGKQAFDRRRRLSRRRMCCEPDRVAIAGAMTLDVENVLDREGQSVKGTISRTHKRDIGVAAKGVERVPRGHWGRCSTAGRR